MDEPLFRALIAGIGVAVIAGPIGLFVVWRRMAFFGDTLAHAALLGIVLGYGAGLGADTGVVLTCIGVAVVLTVLQRQKLLAGDTILGVLSHGSLALGLIILGGSAEDLLDFLFGDILSVSWAGVAWVYGGGVVVLAMLFVLWRPLLAATINEDLAAVEGVPVTILHLGFMVMLAIVVALAMKVVGILMVTALLIIPAAAARPWSNSPEQMAVLAAVAGFLAVGGGLWGSIAFDAPSGPSIVVAALILFAAGVVAPVFKRN